MSRSYASYARQVYMNPSSILRASIDREDWVFCVMGILFNQMWCVRRAQMCCEVYFWCGKRSFFFSLWRTSPFLMEKEVFRRLYANKICQDEKFTLQRNMPFFSSHPNILPHSLFFFYHLTTNERKVVFIASFLYCDQVEIRHQCTDYFYWSCLFYAEVFFVSSGESDQWQIIEIWSSSHWHFLSHSRDVKNEIRFLLF